MPQCAAVICPLPRVVLEQRRCPLICVGFCCETPQMRLDLPHAVRYPCTYPSPCVYSPCPKLSRLVSSLYVFFPILSVPLFLFLFSAACRRLLLLACRRLLLLLSRAPTLTALHRGAPTLAARAAPTAPTRPAPVLQRCRRSTTTTATTTATPRAL